MRITICKAWWVGAGLFATIGACGGSPSATHDEPSGSNNAAPVSSSLIVQVPPLSGPMQLPLNELNARIESGRKASDRWNRLPAGERVNWMIGQLEETSEHARKQLLTAEILRDARSLDALTRSQIQRRVENAIGTSVPAITP